MPKNTSKTNKIGTNFVISQLKNIKLFSINFKICISQIIAKILIKQRSLGKIRHCLT